MKRFKCKECGYIHIGDEAPATCPVCGFDAEVFYEMEDSSSSENSGYIEMLDDAGSNTVKLLRQKFDYLTELAAVSLSMSKQAKEESKEEAEIFSEVARNLLEESSVTAMMLGEFLELNTEFNKENLKRKIEKAIEKNKEMIKSFEEDGIDEHITTLEKENNRYIEILEKLK